MARRLPVLVLLSLLCGAGVARAQASPSEAPGFCARDIFPNGWLVVDPAPYVADAVDWLRRPDIAFDCVRPALRILVEADVDAGVDAVAAYVDRLLAPDPVVDADQGVQRVDLQLAVSLLSGRVAARLEAEPTFAVESTPEFGHLRRWVVVHGGASLGGALEGPWYVGETNLARRNRQRADERRATVVGAAALAIEHLAGHDALVAMVEALEPAPGARDTRRSANPVALSTTRASNGVLTLIVENRGPAPVVLGPDGERPQLAIEVQMPDGRFVTVREVGGWPFRRHPEPGETNRRLGPGARATFLAPLPKTGVPARVRLRLAGPACSPFALSGGCPKTPPFDAVVDRADLASRAFRLRGPDGRRSVELRAHVRGEGLPAEFGPEAKAAAGAAALRVLDVRRDPEIEGLFRGFLAVAPPAPPSGPRNEVRGPVADVMRQLCGRPPRRLGDRASHPELGRSIIRDVLADPTAPNRAAIARAGEGCDPLPLVAERLEHMSDPDLSAFLWLVEDRLEVRYWPPGAQAVARLSKRSDAPAAVREQARVINAAWGEGVVRMWPALTSNVIDTGKQISLNVGVDIRTERPVSICSFVPGRDCVDLVLRDETGRVTWRSDAARADAPRKGLEPVFLHVVLPEDLADGRYPFEARPAVSIAGSNLPAIGGVLEHRDQRWAILEPQRATWVIVVPPTP